MTGKTTDVAKIRAQIKHPIVDGDGHWVESVPVLIDYVSQVAGPKMAEAYAKFCTGHRKWYDATDEQRKQQPPSRRKPDPHFLIPTPLPAYRLEIGTKSRRVAPT